MKKSFTIVLSLLFSVVLLAQPGKPQEDVPNVEKMVSNLSTMQKKRIEAVTAASKKEVVKIRTELESIRSQIGTLNRMEGDQSATLFPLFDRESELVAEISKEMYRCRMKIDEVLTPDQVKEFRNSLENERQQRMKGPKPKDTQRTGKSNYKNTRGKNTHH